MQRRSHIVPSHVPFWTCDAEAPIVKTWRAKVCPDKKSTKRQNFSSQVVFLPCRTASECRSIEAVRQEWSWGVRARFRQWHPQSMIPHSHPHNVEEWTICDWRNLALRHCVKPFWLPFGQNTIIQGSKWSWSKLNIMIHHDTSCIMHGIGLSKGLGSDCCQAAFLNSLSSHADTKATMPTTSKERVPDM